MGLSNNINEWIQGRIGLDYFLTHNSRKRTFLFSVSSDQFYSTLGIWEEYIVTSLILSWFRCGIIARVELCNNTWCLLSIEIHRLQIYTFSEQRHKYKLTTDTNLRLAFDDSGLDHIVWISDFKTYLYLRHKFYTTLGNYWSIFRSIIDNVWKDNFLTFL